MANTRPKNKSMLGFYKKFFENIKDKKNKHEFNNSLKLSKDLIDEINYKVMKNIKNSANVFAKINIDINTKSFNIFKNEFGINGRFKQNEKFERLIKFNCKYNESGEFFTYKDLKVKVNKFKHFTFHNKDLNKIKLRKGYSLLSFKFVRIDGINLKL